MITLRKIARGLVEGLSPDEVKQLKALLSSAVGGMEVIAATAGIDDDAWRAEGRGDAVAKLLDEVEQVERLVFK